MLYVKNGKIHSDKILFALPEDMQFNFWSGLEIRDGFKFSSMDNKIDLDVRILDNRPDFTSESVSTGENRNAMSDIFTVERGGLTGTAVFYRNDDWSYEVYDERLVIDEKKIFNVHIVCDVAEETRGLIHTILRTEHIKAFLASIEAK